MGPDRLQQLGAGAAFASPSEAARAPHGRTDDLLARRHDRLPAVAAAGSGAHYHGFAAGIRPGAGLRTGDRYRAHFAHHAAASIAAACYIQFIRGTPLLLQLFFIYYVLPYAGIVLTPFVSGALGLTLNYAAYMAEVFRSGIQAIPKGQWEAGSSVGMSRQLLMRRIILPQAIRIIVPSLGNFFVSIFKDSALVSVITMRDLMFSGELLASATYKHFEIFAMVAVIYFLISYPDGEVRRVDRGEDRHHPTAGRDRHAELERFRSDMVSQ